MSKKKAETPQKDTKLKNEPRSQKYWDKLMGVDEPMTEADLEFGQLVIDALSPSKS